MGDWKIWTNCRGQTC